MAQQIVTYCDPHLDREEQVVGKPRPVSVDGRTIFLVDACEQCDKEVLEPVRELIAAHGRKIDQEDLDRILPRARPRGKSTRESLAERQFQCPAEGCQRSMIRTSLRTHIPDAHGTTLPILEAKRGKTLDGRPIKYHCTCGGGFAETNGLSRHEEACADAQAAKRAKRITTKKTTAAKKTAAAK